MVNYQFSIYRIKKIIFTYPFLFILFTFLLIKQAIWMGLVPLWHFPDEQAHFAQVANVAYFGNSGFEGNRSATSDEIATSEIILDTYRDESGRNKYTFHPEYNLSYADGGYGFWEDLIINLTRAFTHEVGLNEATVYPPLYYFVGALTYRLGWDMSLIDRVYLVRVVSVLLFAATVFPLYLIAQKIFHSQLLRFVLISTVMFQPMYSFVGAGVTSDILFNFIYACFLCIGVYLIEKITIKRLLTLCLILFLGSISKQQMAIAYLSLPVIALFQFKKIKIMFENHRNIGVIGLLGLVVLSWLAFRTGEFYRISKFITVGSYVGELNNLSIFDHIRWTLTHTYREVLPWYWGIFKWLGVTLPRWAHRVQMSLIAGAVIGNLVYASLLVKSWWKTKKVSYSNKAVIFLYLASAIYFACLMMWDFYFRRAYGFSFGMQGRYYFPVLISHMVFIIVGWRQMFEVLFAKFKLKQDLINYLFILIGVWWLGLHAIGLWVVAKAYYDVSSLGAFIIQVSQYKPLIFKGYWWIVWLGLFILTQIAMLLKLVMAFLYEQKNAKH